MAWYRVFALSPPSLSPVRKREIRDSPERRKKDNYKSTRSNLESGGGPYSLLILLSEELSTEDSCSAYSSEYAEIEYEDKLVSYADTAHLFCSYAPYHYIVQKVNEVGDSILYGNGQCYGQDHEIEGLVSK